MKEELLQFIWSHGLFNRNELKTTTGEPVIIETTGTLNHVSGPDFLEARIRIGDTLWAGNVEIHTRASEWRHHKHQHDQAYNNVVLHVVYENDEAVQNERGEEIPTLVLAGRISQRTISNYEYLKFTKDKIPCASQFRDIANIQFKAWLQRMLISRLERKTMDIELMWKYSGKDWLQTFYVLFCGYLGQNHNKLPFQELARNLPFHILSKYANDGVQLESLIFGVAGLLENEVGDDKYNTLKSEFEFLQKKHGLKQISQQWKLGGIRPEAFPFRRLALLSVLSQHLQLIYEGLLNQDPVDLNVIPLGNMEYWNHRYSFEGAINTHKPIRITSGLNQILAINIFAPFLFFYGKQIGEESHMDFAINILEKTGAEKNKIVKSWIDIGFSPKSAADSQSLIELTSQYCDHKKCVICNVGKLIISKQ